jgi:hypothetical protein
MQYRHGFAAIVVGTMMVLSACTFEPKYVRPEAPMSAPSAAGVDTSPAADVGRRDFFPDDLANQSLWRRGDSGQDVRVELADRMSSALGNEYRRALDRSPSPPPCFALRATQGRNYLSRSRVPSVARQRERGLSARSGLTAALCRRHDRSEAAPSLASRTPFR